MLPEEFILWCSDLNVDFLTVFAFSTENWKRDEKEVKVHTAHDLDHFWLPYKMGGAGNVIEHKHA